MNGAVSASASASWNGAELVNVTNWWVARTASVSGGGAMAQPTFHPVTLNVLPMLSMVIVRSRMPGSVAIGTWRAPSKVSSE